MNNEIKMSFEVPANDFTRAGEASSSLKSSLKKMGVDPEIVRKVSIAMYEGEINMVIHASGGWIEVTISPEEIVMILKDHGPGIDNIELAMQAGYSTAPDNIRNLGFGAGMGLPNMKKYSDELEIESKIGIGTTVTIKIKMA